MPICYLCKQVLLTMQLHINPWYDINIIFQNFCKKGRTKKICSMLRQEKLLIEKLNKGEN